MGINDLLGKTILSALLRKFFLSQLVNDMGKKSIKSDAIAAKAATARRKAEIEMVSAIGHQINMMVSSICEAAIECRRIDFEAMDSKDKAEVLIHEGTTLQACLESNNKAIVEMWGTCAPIAVDFLRQMAQVQATEAQASLVSAQADLLNAQSRAQEASIKRENSETERLKAENARIRSEIELEAAREREESRRRARWEAKVARDGGEVNGIDANDMWE